MKRTAAKKPLFWPPHTPPIGIKERDPFENAIIFGHRLGGLARGTSEVGDRLGTTPGPTSATFGLRFEGWTSEEGDR